MIQDKIFKLKGKVQHYSWGGFDFIPSWLGVENKEHKPYAEYWMGAHPSASSCIIINNEEKNLNNIIKENSTQFLGEDVKKIFGSLPYLFKILDVKEMLSIQVHPTKKEAEKGFDEEEKKGIALNAANRNYKDRNHKPEVMVALSEFWLLHGFLKEEKLLKVLNDVPEFNDFKNIFKQGDYKNLYEHVMRMPQDKVDAILPSLIKREIERKKNNALNKNDAGWWVSKLYEAEEKPQHADRGIFSIYFFNIVKAIPGEAVFQGAGLPHAYLEGQNAELMANSDNVLRGGLTPKYVDVDELIKHIQFEGIEPNVMKGKKSSESETNYDCPVEDFGISKLDLNLGNSFSNKTNSFEIIAVINGEIIIEGTNTISLHKGEVAAILPNESYKISTKKNALAYRAFVP